MILNVVGENEVIRGDMYSFFIRRPVVAICVALMVVLGGLVSIWSLPVAQYPDIVPPEVSLTATYPGADCETVADSVAAPIEQQMSGVPGMEYMTSTSTNEGAMSLSVLFDIGSGADMDQVLAYLRYAQSTAQLPPEVQQTGVSMRTLSGPPMLLYVLRAPEGEYGAEWLSNYAYINFVNPLLRTPGVGNVQVFGAGEYAMRIWLRPQRLAALGLTVQQVQSAVAEQNAVHPVGKVGAAPALPGQKTTYTVRTKGRLKSVEEFGNIILRADETGVVRLRDVARVELGCETYNMSSSYNGGACAIVAISQSPGSNALQTVRAVESTLSGLNLAPGLELEQVLNTTESVRLGIEEIVYTLGLALLLVALVVYVFLQGWRATLIPLTAVPVSVVGTFVFFPLFGMEINTICLMGLVLAIGLVVDDAIVVVEAVEAQLAAGLSPHEATLKAMHEVAGPVMTTALVLAAVFFPCMLLPGITGRLFAQFAVTIGVSILLSAFCALSLSPALCVLLLRREKGGHGLLGRMFNRLVENSRSRYVRVAGKMIRCGWLAALLLVSAVLCLWPLSQRVPGGFLPGEDEGYLYGLLQLPAGSSLEVTEKSTDEVVKLLLRHEAVKGVVMVNGFNLLTGVQSPNNAFYFMTLQPWAQRSAKSQSAAAVAAELSRQLRDIASGGIGTVIMPPPIPGVGATSDVTFMVEDRAGRGSEYLAGQVEIFLRALEAYPEIAAAQSFLAADTPQYFLTFNMQKALTQGVNPSAAYGTLQTFLGSSFINYFNLYGYQYPVYMQAESEARMRIDELREFYLPGAGGTEVPLDALVDLRFTYGPEYIMRQNMYGAAMLNVSAAPGYTAAQVMSSLEECFARNMPEDMGYSYSGMSYQQKKAAEGMSMAGIFAISGIFAYLLLAALYESWLLPLSIVMSVPVALLGAFLTLWVTGQQLDLYAEIGLIMLIGLAAKNAILVVEFAQDRLREGMPLLRATLAGASVRLRPILMTSFAFILGCVPLAVATGPGAEARRSIGVTVIGGMCAAAFVGVLFIPFCYRLVAAMRSRRVQ